MSTESTIGYLIELDDFNKLKQINKDLFGDGSTLDPDKRRDMANLMHLVLNDAIAIIASSSELALIKRQQVSNPIPIPIKNH
jgi:hypothetical protein